MTSRPRKPGGGIKLGAAYASMGSTIVETAGASMPAYAQHVADTAEIAPNPRNKRRIDPESEDIQELANSLTANGQMQSIAVVHRAEFLAWEGFDRYRDVIGDAKYIVIGGGRRLAAARVAKRKRLDISIKSGLTREQFLRMTLIENIDRRDLTPLEEARQIQELREETGDSYAQIGEQLEGRSKGWVAQRLDLLKLSERLQAELDSDEKGSMTITQARTLLKRIRDEIGESDDATMPDQRQWELWEELRSGIGAAERLPRKRPGGPEAVSSVAPVASNLAPAAPVNPEATTEATAGAPAPAFSSPEAPVAAPGIPGTPTPRAAFSSPEGPHARETPPPSPAPSPRRTSPPPSLVEGQVSPTSGNEGTLVVRMNEPVADIAETLRRRMSPAMWAEFTVEVQRLATADS